MDSVLKVIPKRSRVSPGMRLRREDQGAAGAERGGVGCGEGVSLSPLGERSGREPCPLPRNVLDFCSEKK